MRRRVGGRVADVRVAERARRLEARGAAVGGRGRRAAAWPALASPAARRVGAPPSRRRRASVEPRPRRTPIAHARASGSTGRGERRRADQRHVIAPRRPSRRRAATTAGARSPGRCRARRCRCRRRSRSTGRAPRAPRLVAARGPSTNDHSARARPAAPTPLQLGSGGRRARERVRGVERARQRRDVGPPGAAPRRCRRNRSPTASDRCRVTCQVGSIVPAKRRPSRPARRRRQRVLERRQDRPVARRGAGPSAASRRAAARWARPRARRIAVDVRPRPEAETAAQPGVAVGLGRQREPRLALVVSSSFFGCAAPRQARSAPARADRCLRASPALGARRRHRRLRRTARAPVASPASAATTKAIERCAPAGRENRRRLTACTATRAAGSR